MYHEPASYLCSSYRPNIIAIDISLENFIDTMEDMQNVNYRNLLICSDSQSSFSALELGLLNQPTYIKSEIWRKLLIIIKRYRFDAI